jgi:CheY-like chemotaxis protein
VPVKKIVISASPELLGIVEPSFFQRDGFVLLPGRDGEMLFRMVESEGPALVIIDLEPAGDNGLEWCRRIRQDPLLKATPLLLVLPESGGEAAAERCRELACELLPRPLDAGRLLDVACGLLGVSRRLAPRIPVDCPAVYRSGSGKPQTGRIVNLNSEGVFVAGDRLYPVGTGVRLEMALPGNSRPLVGFGRVAWVNHPEWRKKTSLPCGMGVQLEFPAEEDRRALLVFVAAAGL